MREFGAVIGTLPPGRLNAITTVSHVRVSQATLVHSVGALRPGVGPARTGVTVILPHDGNLFRENTPAAIHVITGFGTCMG